MVDRVGDCAGWDWDVGGGHLCGVEVGVLRGDGVAVVLLAAAWVGCCCVTVWGRLVGCGVLLGGVVSCVVWCGVVWCGVVWCGVVWRGEGW